MVAYSFKRRFRVPIVAGIKQQTIRADRKRHARPGEQLQLFTGTRTRQCALIGLAVCVASEPIRLDLDSWRVELLATGRDYSSVADLDQFAMLDGFPGFADMVVFWRAEHPALPVFCGVLIRWNRFKLPATS